MTQVITHILLQSIVPAISDYNVLKRQLISTALKIPAEKVKGPCNSLTSFWSQNNKKPLWDQLKAASIKLGLDYMANNSNNCSLLVIYGLLADCRRIIAKVLHQECLSSFGKPRTEGLLKSELGGPHIQHKNNRYADFYLFLKYKLDGLPQKTSPLNKSTRVHDIVIDGKIISSIVLESVEKGADLFINHCEANKELYSLLNNHLQTEFKNYLQATEDDLIIASVARLVYYLTLAMPLERGSAATTEMLSVVLLLHKGLRFEYTNSLIMDLAAYFAGGRDAFVEQFKESLVPQMEDEFSISELVGSLSFDNTYLDETLDLSSEEEENISSCIVS